MKNIPQHDLKNQEQFNFHEVSGTLTTTLVPCSKPELLLDPL